MCLQKWSSGSLRESRLQEGPGVWFFLGGCPGCTLSCPSAPGSCWPQLLMLPQRMVQLLERLPLRCQLLLGPWNCSGSGRSGA